MTGSGRLRFTDTDDELMLGFLVDELHDANDDALNPKGNLIWNLAQRRKITEHPSQAMRDRFRRVLYKKLLNSRSKLPISPGDREYLVGHLGIEVVAKTKIVEQTGAASADIDSDDERFLNGLDSKSSSDSELGSSDESEMIFLKKPESIDLTSSAATSDSSVIVVEETQEIQREDICDDGHSDMRLSDLNSEDFQSFSKLSTPFSATAENMRVDIDALLLSFPEASRAPMKQIIEDCIVSGELQATELSEFIQGFELLSELSETSGDSIHDWLDVVDSLSEEPPSEI